jgi:multidrug efflux pump subunit AcrB
LIEFSLRYPWRVLAAFGVLWLLWLAYPLPLRFAPSLPPQQWIVVECTPTPRPGLAAEVLDARPAPAQGRVQSMHGVRMTMLDRPQAGALPFDPLQFPWMRLAVEPDRPVTWIESQVLAPLRKLPGIAGAELFPGAFRWQGQPARQIKLFLDPQACALRTAEAVRARLPAQVKVAYDGSILTLALQRQLWQELGLATLLGGAVAAWAGRNWRLLGVAWLSMPSALMLAMLAFWPLGLSLNSSSLIGLVLCLGRMVDDLILDSSAIDHHQGQVGVGCREMRTVLGWTTLLATLAVLPLMFLGGLTQAMFRAILWPYVLGLAAAYLVSVSLTPALLGLLLGHSRQRTNPQPSQLGPVKTKPAWLQALVLLAVLYVALLLVPRLRLEMMPQADTALLEGLVEGGSLYRLESVLRQQPEVLSVCSEVGPDPKTRFWSGYEANSFEQARLWIELLPKQQRKRDLWQVAKSVRQQLPEFRRLSLKEMGSDLMASSMPPVELIVVGPQRRRLEWLGWQMLREAPVGLEQPSLSDSLDRWDGQPSLSLYGFVSPGGASAMELTHAWSHALVLPQGYRLHMRGDMLPMMSAGERLVRGLWLAALGLALVLSWRYGPRTAGWMLLCLPWEWAGGALALHLAGQSLSTVALLGWVVLLGMDLSSAALWIALGGARRKRPLLLTLAATWAVLLPLILRPGTGMESYVSLAWVILGGLTASTLGNLWLWGEAGHNVRIARNDQAT